LAGKGGDKLDDAVRFANGAGATGLIICVNAFTDTPASAGAFAAYAKSHGITVLAWQLANEANLRQFRSFYPTASDYAAKMRPFATAIKLADPFAKISLFASNASFPDTAWDNALATYQPRYWDLLTYHQYPLLFSNAAADLIPQLNAELAVNSSDYVESQIVPRFGRMPILITETDPGLPGPPGVRNMFGTLYGGIWAAEYVLRMSKLPQVKHVGMHQLIGPGGVDTANAHIADVVDAYRRGSTLDTRTLDFGLVLSAQGVAYALAASAINSASSVYFTTILGGGTVPLAPNKGTTRALVTDSSGIRVAARPLARSGETAPAVYAQAYGDRRGKAVVVVTNKGDRTESLAIRVDGVQVSGPFQLATVSGPSPSSMNSVQQATVKRTMSTASQYVQVPPYSVVRLTW
jgi:hypothetical protein